MLRTKPGSFGVQLTLKEFFLIFRCTILIWTTARIYAKIWAQLEQQGRKVSAHDLMIASTALARGFSVATFNERDYRKIEGLSLEFI